MVALALGPALALGSAPALGPALALGPAPALGPALALKNLFSGNIYITLLVEYYQDTKHTFS